VFSLLKEKLLIFFLLLTPGLDFEISFCKRDQILELTPTAAHEVEIFDASHNKMEKKIVQYSVRTIP